MFERMCCLLMAEDEPFARVFRAPGRPAELMNAHAMGRLNKIYPMVLKMDPGNLLRIHPSTAVKTADEFLAWERDVEVKISLLKYLFDCVCAWSWGGKRGMRFAVNGRYRRRQWGIPCGLVRCTCVGREFTSFGFEDLVGYGGEIGLFVARALLEPLLHGGVLEFALVDTWLDTRRSADMDVGWHALRKAFLQRTPQVDLYVEGGECHGVVMFFTTCFRRMMESADPHHSWGTRSVFTRMTFKKERATHRSTIYILDGRRYHISGYLFISLPELPSHEKTVCNMLTSALFRA